MASSGQHKAERARVRVLMAVIVCAFMVLVGGLFRVQIVRANEYEVSLDQQSIRRVRLPGVRGRVYDRYGQLLCDNRPSFCISIYIEELRKPGRSFNKVDTVDKLVDRLSGMLSLPRELTREQIEAHAWRRLPLPLVAWRDVSKDVVAKLLESSEPMPGVDIEVVPRRMYPQGQTAAHVLGYVGRARSVEAAEDQESFDYYLPDMVGRAGVEKRFNEELSGVAGGALLRVDVMGFKHEEVVGREPIAGNDLVLALDVEIQKVVESVLGGRRGACVVMDPRNGDILAMASAPTYDLGLFTPRVSTADWTRLRSNPDLPLINRAISAVYPPGSIFKPVVAMAALQNGVVTPATSYNCPGHFMLGKAEIDCWRSIGHGQLAMRKAIEQSCNTYFCQIGMQCDHTRIYHMARAAKLGVRTGVELDGELPGLVPNAAWKRRRHKEGWRPGDTANISIGQGALLVTPLQMAMLASTLGNGGNVYRPRLVLKSGEPGALLNRLNLSAETREVVRGGMRDVIQAATGTGRNARVFGVEMGGKTGTAQYGPSGAGKKHVWMIVFAPFDSPRYALAMVIEDGQSGGGTVGPRVKRVMETIFQLEAVRGVGADT